MSESFPAELKDLTEQVGNFIHYWGFKSIHGKIWLQLYLSDGPLDSAELIRRLAVSKALISISIADLSKYGVVHEAGTSPHGTQLYTANPDLYDVILRVLREREKEMLAHALDACRQVKGLAASDQTQWKISASRVKALEEFVSFAQDSLDRMLKLDRLEFEFMRKFMSKAR